MSITSILATTMESAQGPHCPQNKSKIEILQHNCARSTNAMQSCLDAATGSVDIVLFQEPQVSRDYTTTISHPSFTAIIPTNTLYRPRVLTFIAKDTSKTNLICTPRPDITMDFDIQALSISSSGLRETLILNIYNKKDQNPKGILQTIERSLQHIQLSKKSLVLRDFNAHYPW